VTIGAEESEDSWSALLAQPMERAYPASCLLHRFCTRLAARNVPLVAIKDLAGHRAIETTMRYAHVSTAAPREAIKALEVRGDILETGKSEAEEARKAE